MLFRSYGGTPFGLLRCGILPEDRVRADAFDRAHDAVRRARRAAVPRLDDLF